MVWVKRLLIAVVAIVLLLFAAVAIALLTIDTRMIQDRIAAAVEEETGRTLHFEGELSLSFFPWLGFELGESELANASGFDGPFARIERTDLRLEVLPLLRRQVSLDTVIVQGLQLNLAMDADGRSNWADLEEAFANGEVVEAEGEPVDVDEEEPRTEPADPLADLPFELRVNGFELRDARLTWNDAGTGTRATVRDLDLVTGPLALGEATPVTLGLRAEIDDGPAVTLQMRTRATVELAPMIVNLDDLVVELEAHGDDLPAAGVTARLEAAIAANLDEGRVRVDPLRLRLDDTRGEGELQVMLNEIPRIETRLHFDEMDLDRYLPEEAEDPEVATEPGEPSDREPGPETDPVAELPLEALRGLDADARLRFDRLGYNGLDATDVVVDIVLAGGVLTLEQFRAGVSEGTIAADARLDARTDRPAVGLNMLLDGVQAGPIAAAFMEEVPVVGRMDSTVELTTRGATLDDWIGRLDGRITAEFTDGGIQGFNIARHLRVASARYHGHDPETADVDRETDFSTMRVIAIIERGVIRTEVLDIRAPLLRVTGDGTVNLPRERIDYTARITITDTLEGQAGVAATDLRGLTVPVRITGPLDDPSVRLLVDEAFAQRMRDEAEAAREALRREQEAAEERLRLEREEAERRARERLERQKKEAEEELRDRIRGLFD